MPSEHHGASMRRSRRVRPDPTQRDDSQTELTPDNLIGDGLTATVRFPTPGNRLQVLGCRRLIVIRDVEEHEGSASLLQSIVWKVVKQIAKLLSGRRHLGTPPCQSSRRSMRIADEQNDADVASRRRHDSSIGLMSDILNTLAVAERRPEPSATILAQRRCATASAGVTATTDADVQHYPRSGHEASRRATRQAQSLAERRARHMPSRVTEERHQAALLVITATGRPGRHVPTRLASRSHPAPGFHSTRDAATALDAHL